ncbi:exodeoxyribonuclease VII small subunit [Crassaminicella profunda]|uniref:exodeoxyribonuclease VII small subunit n=1 Tax=Crassaminicella profunda TaxID=1286698 RepID=UPI001FE801F8|nr:exodeoxyribonuclease VII small subunit [Crassaminicella profunda]
MNTSQNLRLKNNDSFENALKKLEEVLTLLDEGKLTLDETLSLYEEGIKLYRYCNNILDQAEQKISIMMDGKEISFSSCDLDDFRGE